MTYTNSIDWLRKDPSHIENLGITNSAGTTFTVNSANGSALSARNAAYVTLDDKTTPGRKRLYRVTANQSFTQADIAANNFGLTNGVANATDVPFFLYAVANDNQNAIAFMVSRYPNTLVSPVAAKIGKAGSAVANSQGSFFSLANITVADYESNPCLCIGSFRMTWAATNNWTVTTFNTSDGIGNYQEDVTFSLSAGQFGAASGKYFADNGGTAPAFSSNNFGYKVSRQNILQLVSLFTNCTTAGVGAVNLRFAMPFFVSGEVIGDTRGINAASNIFVGVCNAVAPANNNFCILYWANETSSLIVQNASVTISAAYQISHNINNAFIDFS